MDWTYSDYISVILTGVAIVFLLSIIFDYWKGEAGLRKGSVLISFVAIILLLMPNASDIIFKFAGNELTFKANEEQQIDQSQLAETGKFIEKQNKILSEKMDGIANSLKINGEILKIIHQNGENNIETRSKLASLVEKQEVITKTIAPELLKYLIRFESLEFNEVCEQLNSHGEFYYTFMINGNRVISRSLEDRTRMARGDKKDFSEKSIEVQSAQENDTFRLTGFMNEYDGKTLFGRKLKITKVGEIEDELELKNGFYSISIGDEGSNLCRATLNLAVEGL